MKTNYNRDFELYNNPMIQDEAQHICQKNKIQLRQSLNCSNATRIKIIDRFNYVTHVEFIIHNNYITAFACDGSTAYCKDQFCSHCCAALYYLQQKELLPIKLPLHDKNETTIMDNITD